MSQTTPSPRLTTEIKQFFKKECGLNVSCHKGLSKNPFYRASVPYDNKDTFPLSIRIMLLRAIYGDKEWIQSGSAGNIMPHSIAFKSNDWNKFKEEYNQSK